MSTPQVHRTPFLIEARFGGDRARNAHLAPLRSLEAALEVGLLVLLMGAVLSFGAVQSWGVFGVRILSMLLLALWTARQVTLGKIDLPDGFLPILLFGVWIAVQWALGITVYRYQTGQQWITWAAYLFLMLAAAAVASDPARRRRFLMGLSVFGTLLAIFAMVQDVSGTQAIYWKFQSSALAVQIYGPFFNRNHYAGLMELLAPLPFLLALSQRPERRLPLIGAGLLIVLSVFLSRSRGGMIALVAELIFIAVFLSRIRHRARSFAGIGVITAILAVLIVWVGSDPVVHRLTDMKDASRIAIARDTLHMWWSRPVAGYGAGTFEIVYPTFQSFVVDAVINHAHNDYLELLSETGLIGMGLISWFLVAIYRNASNKIRPGTRTSTSAELIAILAGITGLLVHSLVDFNFHVPSNASLFLVMGAIAMAAPGEAAETDRPLRGSR